MIYIHISTDFRIVMQPEGVQKFVAGWREGRLIGLSLRGDGTLKHDPGEVA